VAGNAAYIGGLMNIPRFGARSALVLLTSLAAAIIESPLTLADEAQSTNPSNTPSNTELQEIIVTAQRRDENIQKVPISMTALSQGMLDDLHIENLSDIASVVPGVVLPPRPTAGAQGLNEVSIRGVVNGFNAPTTAIYIDDTPVISQLNVEVASTGSPQPEIFDLARVEVLRGPQGTLFGQGAMGGAIRYITPQPNLNDASGYAKAEFSYTQTGAPNYAIGTAYGAPIVPGTLGFRVSGWFQSDGGFIDLQDPYTGETLRHDVNKDHSYVVRPAITWAPTEGLTITPAAYISDQHSDAPSLYWQNLLPQAGTGYLTGDGYSGFQPTLEDRLEIYSLVADYAFSGVTFHSGTSYTFRHQNANDDYSYVLPLDFQLNPLDPRFQNTAYGNQNEQWVRAWQQEFRLQSNEPGARFTWLLGAYFRHDADKFQSLFSGDLTPIALAAYGQTSEEVFGPNYMFNGGSYSGYTAGTSTLQQVAGFANLTYEVFSHLKASVGVRVEHMSLYNQHQETAGPIYGSSAVDLPDTSQTPVTPRYSLSYQYTDTGMVYAAAAKGFRVGGSNNVAPINSNPTCKAGLDALGYPNGAPEAFDSDSLWSYELGAKDSLFNQRLIIQASVYYIDWSGIQQALSVPGCTGGGAFTANLGKVVSQGFDLQIAAIPVKGLTLGANVGYDHAYYPNALYGVSETPGTPPPLRNGAGDLLQLPPWTAAVNAEYAWNLKGWADAHPYARVDYRWTDAYPIGDLQVSGANDAVLLRPNEAYSLVNLRFGVRRGGSDVSAFVSNATHSDPRLGVSNSGQPQDPLFVASAIQPRTFGLTALWHF
jgi:iron complex outermembrane recepter protein